MGTFSPGAYSSQPPRQTASKLEGTSREEPLFSWIPAFWVDQPEEISVGGKETTTASSRVPGPRLHKPSACCLSGLGCSLYHLLSTLSSANSSPLPTPPRLSPHNSLCLLGSVHFLHSHLESLQPQLSPVTAHPATPSPMSCLLGYLALALPNVLQDSSLPPELLAGHLSRCPFSHSGISLQEATAHHTAWPEETAAEKSCLPG